MGRYHLRACTGHLPSTYLPEEGLREGGNDKLQACHNKLPVDVIVCVSLAVSCVRVNLPEFPRYFYCLIF